MLNGKYEWKLIEKRLIDMTRKQDKVFESFPLSRKKQTPEPVKKRGLKR